MNKNKIKKIRIRIKNTYIIKNVYKYIRFAVN